MVQTLEKAPPLPTVKKNGTPVAKPGPRVVVVEDVDGLAEHVPAWEDLAANALEANPYFEPWMLIPAIRAFGGSENLVFVLVYGEDTRRPADLCGFFPFQRSKFKKLPVRVLRIWQHLHCFLGTPLVRKNRAGEALTALFDWARTDRRGAPLLELNMVAGEGPFHKLLVDFFHDKRCPFVIQGIYNRAFWQASEDVESYQRQALSSSGRQDFRRKRKRLGEQGRLEFRHLDPGGDVDLWIQQFLDLEAGGWKGEMQTALAADPVQRDYFRDIAQAAFQRGQLQMLGLFLDERPIALKCNFRAGDGAFVFKPAYDESYSRFSPGALLELDNMTLCHQLKPPVRWMDSCTVPDHPMWNRLWMERRPIQSLLISTGKIGGDLLVSLVPLLKWLGKLARRAK